MEDKTLLALGTRPARRKNHPRLGRAAAGVRLGAGAGAGLLLDPGGHPEPRRDRAPYISLRTSPPPRDTHLSWARKAMFNTAKKGNLGLREPRDYAAAGGPQTNLSKPRAFGWVPFLAGLGWVPF